MLLGLNVLLKSKGWVAHSLKRKDKHYQTCALKEAYVT